MSIASLRSAVTTAGGSPAHYDEVGLLRELITAKGGTPTQFSVNMLLREAITAWGGTPTQYAYTPLLRQFVTALGGTPATYDPDALWAQIAPLAISFTPLSITPDLYFDASDLSSLKQLSNGTGAVSADNDPVGYWLDKSVNAKTFTQGTAGARPVLDITSGKYSLQFDGTDDSFNAAGNPLLSDLTAGAAFEIIIGGRFNTVGTDNADYSTNDAILADGLGNFAISARSSGKIGAYLFDAGVAMPEDIYTVGQPFALSLSLSAGVARLQIYNRTAVTANMPGNGSIDTLTANLLIGKNNGSAFSDLNIHCILARKTVLTSTERTNAMAWAAAKAGA